MKKSLVARFSTSDGFARVASACDDARRRRLRCGSRKRGGGARRGSGLAVSSSWKPPGERSPRSMVLVRTGGSMLFVDVDYECAWFFLVDVVITAARRRRRRRSARRATRDDDGDDDEVDVRDRDRVVDARDARDDASHRRRARDGDVPRTVHGRARDEDAGDVRRRWRRRRRRRRERYRWTHRGGDVGVLREEGARRATTERARWN